MNAIYLKLSRIPIIRGNYSLKFLFIAFLGIHLPLIGVIAYALTNENNTSFDRGLIITALIFTLISTAITVYALNKLLTLPNTISKRLDKNTRVEKSSNPAKVYQDEEGKLKFLLQDTFADLNKLSIEKQEITSLVSHNLRTPLNQILGFCELMNIDKENTPEYIEKIELVAQSQLRNLSDLLTQLMAKGQQSNASAIVAYNVNHFVKQEVAVVDDLLSNKNLEVVLHLSNDSLNVDKNKTKVSLAFQNLLSNAVKFSHFGGRIHIYTRKKDDIVEIEVLDEGMGFPEEYKPRLFKDARNIGRKGTNNEPSTGLGLHLSKKIIDTLGGKLTAFSEGDGKGASFKISL